MMFQFSRVFRRRIAEREDFELHEAAALPGAVSVDEWMAVPTKRRTALIPQDSRAQDGNDRFGPDEPARRVVNTESGFGLRCFDPDLLSLLQRNAGLEQFDNFFGRCCCEFDRRVDTPGY